MANYLNLTHGNTQNPRLPCIKSTWPRVGFPDLSKIGHFWIDTVMKRAFVKHNNFQKILLDLNFKQNGV